VTACEPVKNTSNVIPSSTLSNSIKNKNASQIINYYYLYRIELKAMLLYNNNIYIYVKRIDCAAIL